MANRTLLLLNAKQRITKQITLGTILLVSALMVFNAGDAVTRAANNSSTSANIVVAAGALEIVNTDSTITFSSATAGVASTQTGVVGNLVVRDYRSGPGRWTLYGNSANLVNSGSDYIPAYNITVYPTLGSKVNTETFNTGDIGNGTDGSTLNGNIALYNSSHNSTGAVTFNSLDMNVTVNSTLNADTYTGTLKIFVIATA